MLSCRVDGVVRPRDRGIPPRQSDPAIAGFPRDTRVREDLRPHLEAAADEARRSGPGMDILASQRLHPYW
jgi:hypothetical protein